MYVHVISVCALILHENKKINTKLSFSLMLSADVGCPRLPYIANGYIGSRNLQAIGVIVTYSCYDGYELLGDENRTCLSNRTWSGNEPFCMGK